MPHRTPPHLARALASQDKDDWTSWRSKGDAVLHIELRRWADLFVVAPLSANSLAKMAHGLCDNLVTCVGRAWDFSRPLLVSRLCAKSHWQWIKAVAELAC